MAPPFLPVVKTITNSAGAIIGPVEELRIGATLTATVVTGDGPDRLELGGASGALTGLTVAAPVTSTGGTTPQIGITAATTSVAGSMSAADKTKLNAIGAGATVVSVGATAPITSTGGANPTIAIVPATTSVPGSLSAADKTKLDSLTSGAALVAIGVTAPITSTGGTSPNIGISAASGSVAGSMSPTHYTLVNNADKNATANTLMGRDSSANTSVNVLTAAGLTVGATSSTFAADRGCTPSAKTYGATVTFRGIDGEKQALTLTGNVTFAAPTNYADGATLKLYIRQGGSGSYTASWNAVFIFPALPALSTINAGTLLATTVGDIDLFIFEHTNIPTSRWDCVFHSKLTPP